jgi:hypothetical protein
MQLWLDSGFVGSGKGLWKEIEIAQAITHMWSQLLMGAIQAEIV